MAAMPPSRCRDALFQHVGGGVHDARVDVAGHLEVEQVGAMLGTVEGIGHGLVDGHGGRLGGGVGRVAGVDGQGFDAHGRLPSGDGCKKGRAGHLPWAAARSPHPVCVS